MFSASAGAFALVQMKEKYWNWTVLSKNHTTLLRMEFFLALCLKRYSSYSFLRVMFSAITNSCSFFPLSSSLECSVRQTHWSGSLEVMRNSTLLSSCPDQIIVYFFKGMFTVFFMDHPDEMLQVCGFALVPYIPQLLGCRINVQYFNGFEIYYKYGLCGLFGKITEYVVGKIP